MDIDIFIKSYPKDFEYLRWALKSITKYVTGYKNIHLLIPAGSKLTKIDLPERTKVHYVIEKGKGYLFQQYLKMNAHKYCKSNWIMFTDSDCIFNRPIDLQTLIVDNKVRLLKTKYDQVGDAICYKKPTEEYFDNRFEIEHEFMRRNGMIFNRDTLVKLENVKEDQKEYILSRDTFSEFNVMGYYAAYFDKKYYNVIDTDDWEFEEHFMTQFWSWGGFNTDKVQIRKLVE